MKVDFYTLDGWSELNEAVELELGLKNQATTFQAYGSFAQGLFEVTQGLAKLFPHRKKIFYLKDADPFIDSPAQALAREGLQVEGLTLAQLNDGEFLKTKFDKDTLMVIVAEDDPMLGLCFDFAGLSELCTAQRIFTVCLSHARYRTQPLAPQGRFTAKLCSLPTDIADGIAVGLLGERVKVIAPISQMQSWGLAHKTKILSSLQPMSHDRQKILDFENRFSAHAILLGKMRLWDRAALSWDNIDGHAVIDKLAQRLGFTLKEPGHETRLETTSLGRWGGIRTMDWLGKMGFSPEQIRGLIIVDPNLIDETFAKHLEQTLQEILRIQFDS